MISLFVYVGANEEDSLCGYVTYEISANGSSLLMWPGGREKSKAIVVPRRTSYWDKRNRDS